MSNQEPLLSDDRLASVREALAHPEPALAFSEETSGDRTHAAVSLILRAGEEMEVLFIKRAVAEGDPWSGQMALPGGRKDRADSTLFDTAVRETLEETSVSLADEGLPLGRIEPLVPATVRLPPITIFPFVFGVPEGTEARVASPEVDEVLWVPLNTLTDPGISGIVEIAYKDSPARTFPCWRVDGRVVWGLTYRILNRFFDATGRVWTST
jgi:8-oxo-dGTP pyrophosphatase MutT (NUDIX family)